MCGIFGIANKNKFLLSDVINSLKRLEYRGYDSWGIATNDDIMEKKVGEIPVNSNLGDGNAKVAISHTRWATHGGVTQANAHPHSDCTGNLFVVHNGIIENYLEMKDLLTQKGHKFLSETDTEVIAHFIEEKLNESKSPDEALQEFMKNSRGTFAVLAVRKGDNNVYAAKRDSPLVLGILDGGYAIASDIYAFSDKTNRAVWFENDEYAVINSSGFRIFDSDGKHVNRDARTFEWKEETQGHYYDHYMNKEIHEVPDVAKRLLVSLQREQKMQLEQLAGMVRKAGKIIFVAVGSSYHASLLGTFFLHKAGIDVQTIIASEFRDYTFVDEDTLILAISQSGETMDVIEALKTAKQRGARIASIVNVPYSTVQRMSELSIQILAGQEICVAATKSFINQVMLLIALAAELGYRQDYDKIPEELQRLFDFEDEVKKLARKLADSKDIYIIGRGMSYPVSREIALKLKEISYVHAEGMMGGELKHGTIALIEEGTPVIGLVDNEEIISNMKEVEARGAEVISISDCPTEFGGMQLPVGSEASFALGASMIGHLLSYYIAKERGLPIDKPRNLAKSVTVK
ncbi:MAG: glutamine--fructose-6-phosphate transaminase (isomerizing) [Candidatus Aenigmarchaeota archaeon]|nr:glutamine--fructose-6-phosphate transaminase (isomerizing) [Candidatus Aenigmarchaeota archaeon]